MLCTGRRLLPAAAAVLALTGALAGAVLIYAERRIAPLLDADWKGRYTTRIYSAPFRIRAGDPLSLWELRTRLGDLDYDVATSSPPAPGEYRESEGSIEAHLRGFSHPFIAATPARAVVEIADGRARGLRLAGTGAPLVEAVLEPGLLYEVSGRQRVRRTPLRLDDIPDLMLQALVAVEDRRFYEHPGVDLRGIARAAWRNIRSRRIAEGGSTLTQQLAKNLFLDPRRTFTRKFKEALIAFYLEARFPKEELARIYLDSVYFGQNGPVSIIGLPAAAGHFFAKNPRELTLPESALLAGLVRSPARYDPFRHPEAAGRRRRAVLAAMRREGFITGEEERGAAASPLGVTDRGQPAPRASDYFLSYVQRLIEERYGDQAWITQGVTLHTTLDPWLQERARRAVGKARHQAALVALDPRSGAVRALIGGKDFAESPFDRATQARRQPGSAFKPFVYGAALHASGADRVWTPASLLSDTTREYSIEGGTWTPRNYDRTYRGPVPLRKALALSLNAATVNLAQGVGPRRIIRYARELGIRSPLRPELGLALGVFEVSLLELTGAYCAFANGGVRIEPFAVEAALNAEGEVIEYHSPTLATALPPGEAYLMTSLLRETVTAGTARALRLWGLETVAAGKTGTTDDGKDAWFVGYTPRIAAGVWVGSDRPARLGISGAGAALPIWAAFVKGTEPPGEKPPDPWPRPESVLTLRIDPASGLRARVGCPRSRLEIFLSGTEPEERCPLHAGGVIGWLQRLFRREPPQAPEYR